MKERNRDFFLLLIIINLLGVAYGFGYYAPQLAATQPIYWIFVPDSPLAALLFTLALLLPFRNKFFDFIAAIGLVKVGIWTNMVFVLFSEFFVFSSMDRFLLTIFLGALHIGMIAEAAVVLPKRLKPRHLVAALGWFLLNDYVDYGLGHYPYLPPGPIGLTALLTVALTLGITFALYRLSSRIRRPFMGWIQTLYN